MTMGREESKKNFEKSAEKVSKSVDRIAVDRVKYCFGRPELIPQSAQIKKRASLRSMQAGRGMVQASCGVERPWPIMYWHGTSSLKLTQEKLCSNSKLGG